MDSKERARIRPAQLEILVSFMELYPALAIAQGKQDDIPAEKRKALWLELYHKLNSVEGCPNKTMERWKKTWTDQKTKTQIKAVRLIQNNGHGTKLTPLEERILKILATSNKANPNDSANETAEVPDADVVVTNGIQSLENQELTDSLLSESSSVSVIETPNNVSESLMEIIPTDTLPASRTEFGRILPETPITLTSLDIPTLIKQEPPDVDDPQEEKTAATESVPLITTTRSLLNEFATLTSKKTVERAKKRQRYRFTSKYMTAEKAAESFVNIAERNCIVLERIASAMEAQAAEATKQTQLMQELIGVLRNNK
ncbi:uncharacterized protein [Parasteatoda tepidariorum]|uniref:uncharacterized protein n=1 Tax=Parasteatoda tepidariorum TaxID=114398 RepID=UPI00077F85E0|nr:uncharacterized protein LOC107453310 [Parasteatoda tepidariorum]XP_042899197.1 uncharacterized protein LOC107453310 [Parasteatoda tepidariorum]